MKSFWINLGVADLDRSVDFYQSVGFKVEGHADIQAVTLPEGGTLILFDKKEFAKRAPFSLATEGNEVLISLNVGTPAEVDSLIDRVRQAGGQITGQPTDKYGFYGASFTDLDNHHFNVIVM